MLTGVLAIAIAIAIVVVIVLNARSRSRRSARPSTPPRRCATCFRRTPAFGAAVRSWRSTRPRWSRAICCCWPRATGCRPTRA